MQMVEVYFSQFEMTDRPVAGVLQMRRVETILSPGCPWRGYRLRGDRLLRTAKAAVAHAFSGMMAGGVWLRARLLVRTRYSNLAISRLRLRDVNLARIAPATRVSSPFLFIVCSLSTQCAPSYRFYRCSFPARWYPRPSTMSS